jgi:gluconate kinase
MVESIIILLVVLLVIFGSSSSSSSASIPIFVIFGRPGAGKTTIASEIQKQPQILPASINQGNTTTAAHHSFLHIDLDVCVSQKMKDGFSSGIYPSSTERINFMDKACDFVKGCIDTRRSGCNACIVSFSFVNSDLRHAFRRRFPHSKWILVEASPVLAQNRITRREGHFYKHKDDNTLKGSEWDFAPIDFECFSVRADNPVNANVALILNYIHECLTK